MQNFQTLPTVQPPPNLKVHQRVLDAAEELFANNGFASVSMRDIASLAKAQVSSLTYHFGSKDGLFEAVVARRAEALCERRLAALDAALVAPSCNAESVLAAFMQPYLRLCISDDAGWRNYAKLLAYVGQSPRWPELAEKYFNPTAHLFINSLSSLFPNADRSMIAQGFVFSAQLLAMSFSGTQRVTLITGGEISSDDLKAVSRALLAFCDSGLTKLAVSSAATATH